MNERIYKSTSFQVVKELVLLIVACAFLAFILHFFVKDYINTIVVAVVFVFSLAMTLKDRKLYVKVTDDTLTIVDGKKVYEYQLDECVIKAKIKNNDILTLYVIDSNENTKSFDLSLLGYKQFEKLIEDIRVIGDEAESITLKAK